MADGSWVLLAPLMSPAFDQVVVINYAVILRNGQNADLSTGYWYLGFQQAGGAQFAPMPRLVP